MDDVSWISSDAPPTSTLMRVINPIDWEGMRAPLRDWSWREWMLARSATLLTGAGSAGKSLLSQQLCTYAALGLDFLGSPTAQTDALYVTCEDDADELHRRQEAICEHVDAPYTRLSGHLHLCSLAGEIGNELAAFDASNHMTLMPAWERLRNTMAAVKPGMLVLDNIAHFFAGNENIRAQVAAFCGLMNTLALDFDCAVLFIGHPNKAGADFSGSTAWENQVRSRIFLGRDPGTDSEPADPDVRLLSRGKANYAPLGNALRFRWHRGCFVMPDDVRGEIDPLIETNRRRAAENVFLACLEATLRQKRAVSISSSASSYAPRIFSRMPEAQRTSEHALFEAMERLLHTGAISGSERLFQRGNRQWVYGLGVCTNPCTNPAPTRAPTVHQPLSENP